MSGFSADWLALREAADTAARSEAVLDAARRTFAHHTGDPLEIWDLGSGTGASVTAFSALFPKPQVWHLVDTDADNLKRAMARYAGDNAFAEVRLETHMHDLADNPAPWPSSAHLVTATALFDLVSESWLQAFADRLCAARLPLLATLTYDGRLELEPAHSMDASMIEAFNQHQRTDKGFGPAAGPDASNVLTTALE
ncbi:MAG: hypothetical protein ACR2O4_09600, partial [Hyphomicrobiaceae bacterium]